MAAARALPYDATWYRLVPQSYFALFNLEPRFALPLERLDVAYRALALQVHPDRYANGTLAEQRQALHLATDANEAYRTLKTPLLRARHLLGLRGIEIAESSVSMPSAFLFEQMERHEALIDARRARDDNALRQLSTSARDHSAALRARLADQLDTESDNVAAAQSVLQLMFVEKLIAEIDDARVLQEA